MKSKSHNSARAAVLLSIAALFCLSSEAEAVATTYIYTGNPFSYCNCSATYLWSAADSVSVSLTLSSALPANQLSFDASGTATSFTFTAGPNTITKLSANTYNLLFATNELGDIINWFAQATNDFRFVRTCGGSVPGPPCGVSSVEDLAIISFFPPSTGGNTGSPGSWAVIPEPSTGLLVITGLLGLAYRQRRHGRAA